jgi:hypothetical protein
MASRIGLNGLKNSLDFRLKIKQGEGLISMSMKWKVTCRLLKTSSPACMLGRNGRKPVELLRNM